MSLRVLLIEDSASDRDLTSEALKRTAGPPIELRTVDRLRPAVEEIARTTFDVLLAGMNLPDSSGLDTIRTLGKLGGPPVVAYTSEERPGLVLELIAAGADDYYPKGVMNGDRLRQVLELTAARRTKEGAIRATLESRLEALVLERTAALQTSTAQMRVAANSVSEVIFLQSVRTGLVVFVNDAYRKVLGRDPAGLMRDPADWLNIVHEDDRESARRELFADPNRVPEYSRFRVKTPSGAVRWLQTHITVATDEDGRPEYRAGVVQDITDHVEAEEAKLRKIESDRQLETATQMGRFRLEFLNMAAHELATPLTSVRLQLSTLQLLAERTKDERLATGLRGLDRAVGRLSGLVQDLVEAGRVQSTTLRFRWEDCNVVLLCRACAEMLAPQAADANVTFHLDLPSALHVWADRDRLSQVVLNLLSNAVKYTPGPGRVTVRLTRIDGTAELDVADTGRGIAPDDLAKLFLPFGRVGDTTTTKGTGLGLYITKGLVEAHGGSIVGESAGPGRGSRFVVRLPVRGPPTASPAPPPAFGPPSVSA